MAKRKKTMAFSSPELAVAIVIGELRQRGVNVDESLVLRHFIDTAPRQRDIVYLDHSNVYEKVIAALAQDACDPGGIRPIVFVSDNPKLRAKLKEDLSKIVSVMNMTEVIPLLTYPVVRDRDSAYICPNRYNNAVTNGGIDPLGKEPALTLAEHNLSQRAVKKVCVKNCSLDSCSLAVTCRYARHISALRNGIVKLQIYPRKQYSLGQESGEIPKRSIIIGAPPPSIDLTRQYISCVLSERDFSDYAYLSVYHCDKSKSQKERMGKHVKRFKKLTKFLFDKVCNDKVDSSNLSKWMGELLECTMLIKQESMFTLTKHAKWAKLHSRISGTISCLLAVDKPFDDVAIDREKRIITATVLELGKKAS